MINAFHPEYMKTYEPNFWKSIFVNEGKSKAMSEIVSSVRQKNPKHGTLLGISSKPTPVSLKPLDFMIYSKAGTKGTKAKGKKK